MTQSVLEPSTAAAAQETNPTEAGIASASMGGDESKGEGAEEEAGAAQDVGISDQKARRVQASTSHTTTTHTKNRYPPP
jgi:hypothetical protein